MKSQTNEEIFCVNGVEDLILLKRPYYSKKSTDSTHHNQNPNGNFEHLKTHMELQGTPNSQHYLETEEQSWRTHTFCFKIAKLQ